CFGLALLPPPPLFFSLQGCGHRRDLHSFPTRRSSDLPKPHRSSRSPTATMAAPRLPSRPSTPPSGGSPSRTRVQASTGSPPPSEDRKSTRLNSSHVKISYAVFCLKKKKTQQDSRTTRG